MGKYALGLNVTKELMLTNAEKIAGRGLKPLAGLPASLDWRKNPDNYLTPIQNQSGCGACVAFGTTAVMEVCKRIVELKPTLDVKLSEWDLFSHGGDCGSGWTLEAANKAAITYGVCPERCWPYTGERQPCASDPILKLKISGSKRIIGDAQAKEWLSTKGPIQAAMDVYEDFFNYDSGIYKSEYGGWVGAHCIAIIGYNDQEQCWICKNSWSTSWGDNGYFKIAYGDCGILRSYAAYGLILIAENPDPKPDPEPEPVKDIFIKKPGKYSIQLINNYRANMKLPPVTALEVSLNGLVLDTIPISKLPKYKWYQFGTFKIGDILHFELVTSDKDIPVGADPFGKNYWYLRGEKITFMVRYTY